MATDRLWNPQRQAYECVEIPMEEMWDRLLQERRRRPAMSPEPGWQSGIAAAAAARRLERLLPETEALNPALSGERVHGRGCPHQSELLIMPSIKTLFYAAVGLAILGSLGNVKEATETHSIRTTERIERQALKREAQNAQRASQTALKMAETCLPVVDAATGAEYYFSEGTQMSQAGDPYRRFPYTGFICNSMGFVGESRAGEVKRVFQIAAADRPAYDAIFANRAQARTSVNFYEDVTNHDGD